MLILGYNFDMQKIIVISPKLNFGDPKLVEALEKKQAIFYEQPPVDLNSVAELFDDDEKTLMIDEVLTKGGFMALNEILPRTKNIKHITNLSARYHEVDLEQMKQLGITYSNNPDTTTESVAELAIMDLFALVRTLPLMQKDTFEFYGEQHLGREVREMSAGILGYGNIGSRVAELCAALKMPVKIWSRTQKSSPYEQVDVARLLKQDAIFITLATGDEAKVVFNDQFYNTLQPHQYIVDVTASDELYDKNRLIEMANNKKIAGYAFEAESSKSTYAQPAGNVLITPHVGWGTRDSYMRLYGNWVSATVAAFNGQPINVVNK